MTSDWKRNAGAALLMKRRAASALADGDPKIQTNISIPCLSSGNERVHFLPDMVVLRQGSQVVAQSYAALALVVGPEIFIEEGSAPRDAQVVGYTWRYARRDGGPDRRFNNNRQLPQCRYQSVKVVADHFERTFSKSRLCESAPLQAALRALASLKKNPGEPTVAAFGDLPLVS